MSMKRGNESKPHIGIYGRCNAGKSTLMNLLIGENHAIVSPESGTTTDPVRRSFEILDFAPVMLIDTAGIDDATILGNERRAKAIETLNHIDLAIVTVSEKWSIEDVNIVDTIKKEGLKYIVIHNLYNNEPYTESEKRDIGAEVFESDLSSQEDRNNIIELIKNALPLHSYKHYSMLENRCSSGDVVLLICPIDSEAPSGRIILPQVQAIRAVLDENAVAIVIQPEQIETFLSKSIVPKLIITDSQVVDIVKSSIPLQYHNILTTFSILLAELKGDINLYNEGLVKAAELKQGDKVLIMENCLHQTSCEDIGRVKIPKWLNEWRGCELEYTILSGLTPLPDNLGEYSLVIQCGGCMVTPRQLKKRIDKVAMRGVAITNYGMLIKMIKSYEAKMN